METNTQTPVQYLTQAWEIAKSPIGGDIISLIAVLGGFTYDEVRNACAYESEATVVAMLATQLHLNATK